MTPPLPRDERLRQIVDRCKSHSVDSLLQFRAGEILALATYAARPAVSPSIEEARREELEVENKKLLTFAHEATKLLTFLSGGGSEMFRGVVRDVHLADLPACKARIERNRQALQELNDLRRRKAIEALTKSESE